MPDSTMYCSNKDGNVAIYEISIFAKFTNRLALNMDLCKMAAPAHCVLNSHLIWTRDEGTNPLNINRNWPQLWTPAKWMMRLNFQINSTPKNYFFNVATITQCVLKSNQIWTRDEGTNPLNIYGNWPRLWTPAKLLMQLKFSNQSGRKR